MKKIISLFILLILIPGCNDKSNRKIEVVNLNDNNYLKITEIDSIGDFGRETINLGLDKQISERVEKYIKEQNISKDGFGNYDFILFINKTGKLDKVFVLDDPNNKVTDVLVKALSDLTFVKATKDGKPVNYRINFSYPGVYNIMADPMPEPIGGIAAIQDNIVYPELARRAGVEGRVYILALINENGDVVKTKILKGIGAGCDEAAADAVKKVKFKPGMLNGIPVKVQVTVPVLFKLSANTSLKGKVDNLLSITSGIPAKIFSEIEKNIKYPEEAKSNSIDGTVLVKALLDKKGNVIKTEILEKKLGFGLDEAAQNAVKKVKFPNTIKQSKTISWPKKGGGWKTIKLEQGEIVVPVTFKLNNSK